MTIKKLAIALAASTFLAITGASTGTAHAATNTGIGAPEVGLPMIGVEFPTEPGMTLSQQNAVRSAENYLDFTAFSREGLIQQLEYDEFSTSDATFAVDHITVDWNEQAAKAAENYLAFTSFSRGGLIEQLLYDGFTSAQAAYGASAVGY